MHDVAVIGGGPGGLYAARQLARLGFDVAVFEEHATAGYPVHCTGVLAAEAFADFDIPREAVLNQLHTVRFFGPSGASIEYSTPRVEAVVVDRHGFDLALCEQAKASGATIRVGARISDIHISDSRVSITSGGQPVAEARACILACGASYSLQRRLGLGIPPVYLQSAQIEVPALTPGPVEVHFGADIAPKGFAWVVPVCRGERSYARVGLMCDRDAREHFDRFSSRIGKRWHTIGGERPSEGPAPRNKILPLAPIARTYAARVLAVGDAAGLVKATTGGGIYYSLLSANVATEVLADALRADDLSEASLGAYERRWRSILGDELDAQLMLRRIADTLSDADIESLFELARTDGIMPIVRRTATFNRHRKLILSLLGHPPARRVLLRRALGWSGLLALAER